MIINSPKQVKEAVSLDLKNKNLTQKELAARIGVTRQSVSSILSSHDKYFTDRQATVLSLVMEYDKVFLTTGEGTLYSNNTVSSNDTRLHYLEKRLEIYTKAEEVSNYINALSIKLPKEQCLPLFKKAKKMHDFVSSIYTDDPRFISGKYNPDLMEAALKVFEPLYYDIIEMLEKEYNFEIEC